MLEEEVDLQRWRIHWAAAVALIRAVGHVLDKVDGRDQCIKKVASDAFKRWKSDEPEHSIFREFINRERNNLLKEYSSEVYPLDEMLIAFTSTELIANQVLPVAAMADTFALGDNTYRPMVDGPWAGDDARDVLELAVSWWEQELALIDEQVSRRKR